MGQTGEIVPAEKNDDSNLEVITGDVIQPDSVEGLMRHIAEQWRKFHPDEPIPDDFVRGGLEVAIDHNERKNAKKEEAPTEDDEE
ncbi:MAG TPA: hypothetical protein PLV59_02920 [Candidatus Dojkabacteria bacterium]|nr:hypothetical protein [Candidatus Dojkabacteria bacterium]